MYTNLNMKHLRRATQHPELVLFLASELLQVTEGHPVLLHAQEGDQVGAVRGCDDDSDEQPAADEHGARRGEWLQKPAWKHGR